MTLIIAEAGVNHNGDIDLAKELIDIASERGADIVKFQTFKAEDLVTNRAKKAEYQRKSGSDSSDQLSMLKKLELSDYDFKMLRDHCGNRSIEFLSTAFTIDSLEFLVSLGIKRIKIPSGEITNFPFLVAASSFGLPIILSSGLSYMSEIEQAVSLLVTNGVKKSQITVLHCTTEYPAPIKSVNLSAMKTISEEIGVDVGYSDHTRNLEVPIAAVAMGAITIEKHFTKSRKLNGPDHAASLEPNELSEMITSIRNTEILIGNREKKPSYEELKNLNVIRKSIVAKKRIKKGDILNENNLTTKRPGDGISPMEWRRVINTVAKRQFEKDDLIEI
tara:strand:- start:4266 stop:5264 length:999 start_codon:yes stop_codon:yes gene_type:complete